MGWQCIFCILGQKSWCAKEQNHSHAQTCSNPAGVWVKQEQEIAEPLKAEDRVERNGLTSFSSLVLSLTGTPGQRMPTGQSPTPTLPYPLVLSIPSYAFNWTVLYRHVGDLVTSFQGSRGFEEPDFGPQPRHGRTARVELFVQLRCSLPALLSFHYRNTETIEYIILI